MPDEEFDVLGEEDLALSSRWFEHLYTNQKNTQRSSGMCYQCKKHEHFIAECPQSMEIKPEHKHRMRNDYKGKNKSRRRLRKSGGHKKKTKNAIVARASDIDSSSCYSSMSSTSGETSRLSFEGPIRRPETGGVNGSR
jgi:hypothetical protein